MQWRRRDPDATPRPAQPGWALLRALEARARTSFRKPVLFGALALAALIAGHQVGGLHVDTVRARLVVYGCAAAVAVFGVGATRATGNEVARLIASRAGTSPAASLRIAVLLAGYAIALAAVLDLLALPVHYFVGGTVIAVVLGVAAQQVLGNLFAGLVLLFARPYKPGEYIRIHSGALGGPHEGTVTMLGLLYTTIRAAGGDINIPNGALLAAAVGAVPPGDATAEATADAVPLARDTGGDPAVRAEVAVAGGPTDAAAELPRPR